MKETVYDLERAQTAAGALPEEGYKEIYPDRLNTYLRELYNRTAPSTTVPVAKVLPDEILERLARISMYHSNFKDAALLAIGILISQSPERVSNTFEAILSKSQTRYSWWKLLDDIVSQYSQDKIKWPLSWFNSTQRLLIDVANGEVDKKPSVDIRLKSLEALGQALSSDIPWSKDPEDMTYRAYKTLLDATVDKNDQVRTSAINALGHVLKNKASLCPAGLLPTIQSILVESTADADENIHYAAISSLGHILESLHPEEAARWDLETIYEALIDATQGPSRSAAVTALGDALGGNVPCPSELTTKAYDAIIAATQIKKYNPSEKDINDASYAVDSLVKALNGKSPLLQETLEAAVKAMNDALNSSHPRIRMRFFEKMQRITEGKTSWPEDLKTHLACNFVMVTAGHPDVILQHRAVSVLKQAAEGEIPWPEEKLQNMRIVLANTANKELTRGFYESQKDRIALTEQALEGLICAQKQKNSVPWPEDLMNAIYNAFIKAFDSSHYLLKNAGQKGFEQIQKMTPPWPEEIRQAAAKVLQDYRNQTYRPLAISTRPGDLQMNLNGTLGRRPEPPRHATVAVVGMQWVAVLRIE